MPLTAMFDGSRIFAADMNDESWTALKKSKKMIRLRCCDSPAFARESVLGTKHFVHRRKDNSCTSAGETAEHLRLKAEVMRACLGASWEAEDEVSKGNWRADVLTWKANREVAFEIQLSPIPLSEIERRRSLYIAAGVRSCWFFGPKLMRNLQERKKNIPIFPLADDGTSVQIGGEKLEVGNAVTAWLSGHFRFCASKLYRTVQTLHFYRLSTCYFCRNDFDVYGAFDERLSCSAREVITDYDRTIDMAQIPWVMRAAQELSRKYHGRFPYLGTLERYQPQASSDWHISFCCFHCRRPWGREIVQALMEYGFHTHHGGLSATKSGSFDLKVGPSHQEEEPHWCYSQEKKFCCTPQK